MKFKLEKQKNRLLKIGLCITLVLMLLIIFGFLDLKKGLYIEMYMVLSCICFLISHNWISSLTLFWIQYTIYALGYLFLKVNYAYDPFFVIIGGFLFLLIGYAFSYFRSIKIFRNINIKKAKKRLTWEMMVKILFLFASFMWIIYIVKNRSFLYGGNLESGRVDAMSGNGVFLYSINLNIMIVPMLYLLLKRKEIKKSSAMVMILICALELISVGYRTPLLIAVLCIVVIEARLRKIDVKKAIRYFLILFFIAMIYEIYRAGENISLNLISTKIGNRFGVCMWNLNYVYNTFPRVHPFQYGYTNLLDIIMLLPGPGKDYSMWLKDMVGMSFSGGGLATFIQASFYIDFGNIGIVVGMLFLGLFKGLVDKKIESKEYIGFWGSYLPYAFSMVGGCITDAFIMPSILFVVYSIMNHFAKDDLNLRRLDKR